ncbi:MAG: type II toxin-antitoxin system VapC family toxin [Candidatus Bathyarchaeota archaeon]
MACLDTDILVELLKGERKAVDLINTLQSEDQQLKTTIINAYELIKGAAISSKPEENLAKVKDLLSALQVLTLNLESCEEASKIYRRLKTSGQTIGEFDILIAAITIQNEDALISRDSHFSLIQNLNLQKW